jgi:hypothetical protein
MKKYLMMVLCAVLLAGFACLGIARAAEVVFVEGSVQVQSAADKEWKNAEKGMQVQIGDSVRTARHSRAEIALDADKKNTVRVEEKTLVVLNSATAGTVDRLDLTRGRVYANLEGIKEGLGFEVNTPSAVAGVRGSSYMVYVERDGDEVSAYKDTVYLRAFDQEKNQLGETMLPEGFKTIIDRFELPGALSSISNREYTRFENMREDLIRHVEGREKTKEEREERAPLSLHEQTEQTGEQSGVINEVTENKANVEDQKSNNKIEEFRLPEESGGH